MNLLELLHNEKVVRLLEKIDNHLTEIKEPSSDDLAISWKLILMVETLLNKFGSSNGHIGEYFSRYSSTKNKIDDVDEQIKQLRFKKQDLEEEIKAGGYSVDMNSFEGNVFNKLKEELIEKQKLNYRYGKDNKTK